MTRERIEKAIDVINYAIDNKLSVYEASVRCGYANTYVKNVKAIIYDKYENDTIDDDLFTLFDNAYKNYVNQTNGSIQTNTKNIENEQLSTNEQTKFNVSGKEGEIEWKSGSNYPVGHIKTLDQLLESCNVDLNIWKVKDYTVNKWDVTSWKKENPQTIQNFQVKARLEKLVELNNVKDVADIFIDMVNNYTPPVFHTNNIRQYPLNDENNLFELSIFDLHFGKLAWAGETGENYDTKIARTRFLSSIEMLIQRASGFPYSRILFPVGSDFFNSDTLENTTTKGTSQDEDLRWQKTFSSGVRLIVDGINLLKQTGAPVDVVVIAGNHDLQRSYYMGSFLEAWFNNDPMVHINNGASPRKYYRFGKVLLGLTHGSEEKESSLPLLMANDIESKPMWSETTYHEWHVGHIHRKRDVKYDVIDKKERILNEDLGVTVRYLSSLTGTEEWHHRRGFIGAIKAADAFIWNDNIGLIAHLNSNFIVE